MQGLDTEGLVQHVGGSVTIGVDALLARFVFAPSKEHPASIATINERKAKRYGFHGVWQFICPRGERTGTNDGLWWKAAKKLEGTTVTGRLVSALGAMPGKWSAELHMSGGDLHLTIRRDLLFPKPSEVPNDAMCVLKHDGTMVAMGEFVTAAVEYGLRSIAMDFQHEDAAELRKLLAVAVRERARAVVGYHEKLKALREELDAKVAEWVKENETLLRVKICAEAAQDDAKRGVYSMEVWNEACASELPPVQSSRINI